MLSTRSHNICVAVSLGFELKLLCIQVIYILLLLLHPKPHDYSSDSPLKKTFESLGRLQDKLSKLRCSLGDCTAKESTKHSSIHKLSKYWGNKFYFLNSHLFFLSSVAIIIYSTLVYIGAIQTLYVDMTGLQKFTIRLQLVHLQYMK